MSNKGSPKIPNNDDTYFLSTQIQARHEDVIEIENQNEEKKKLINKLKPYRNGKITSEDIKNQPKKKPKTSKKISGVKGRKNANKKNKSMSSMVRDSYNNDQETFEFDNQRKIDNFLHGLNKEDISSIDRSNAGKLYTKNDWFYIMQNIKLKFPDLNAKSKKSLKKILKKINKLEEKTSAPDSIWSEASSNPDIKLSEDDLRWLYDLDEEQMINNSSIIEDDLYENENEEPFVLTLSQALNNNSDIISDSESEIEILKEYGNNHIVKYDEPASYNKISIQNSENSHKIMPDSIGSLQFKESVSHISPVKKANGESLKFPGVKEFQEEIYSPREFTPQHNLPVIPDSKKSIRSEFIDEEQINSKDEPIILTDGGSINSIQNHEEIISSDSENELISSMPQLKQNSKKRRLLRTTRVEVLKSLNISDYEDKSNNVEIKYIGTKKINIDSENEVGDSDAEGLSIIEITREVDDTDMLINIDGNIGQEKNTSLIQVPSSPEISSEFKEKYSDVLSFDINNEFTDKSQIPESQPIPNTYMTASEYYTPLVHFDKEISDINTPCCRSVIEKVVEPNVESSQTQPKLKRSQNVKNTQDLKQEYEKLTNILKQSQYWFEKIISFEPLFLDELKDWLNSNDSNSTYDKPILEKYCEKHGITYSNASK